MLTSSFGQSLTPVADPVGFEAVCRPRSRCFAQHDLAGMGLNGKTVAAMKVLLWVIDMKKIPTPEEFVSRFNVSRSQAYKWRNAVVEALEVEKPKRRNRHA